MRATIASAFIFLSLTFSVKAQQIYQSDRLYSVPQDNQLFFFQPTQISPYQTGVFSEVMGQFSDHPLSSINRNPANLSQLNEQSYFYIDLKTLPDETIETYYYGCNNCIGPHWYFTPVEKNRTAREPFVSTAFFMKPNNDSGLRFGLTYQLLSMSEPFYQLQPFPYSNYGVRLQTAGSELPAPSTNLLGERDLYRLQGHFPSLYTGYEFSERFSAGIKVSYNYYTGSGSQISEGFGNQPDIDVSSMNNEFSQQRDATYSHWDFSAGMRADLSDRMTAGISIGYLTGDFDQDGRMSFQQINEGFNLNGGDYYYTHLNNQLTRTGFERIGHTIYANADYEYSHNDNSHIILNYRISRADQDFNFGSSTYRFTDSENYHQNYKDENVLRTTEYEETTLSAGTGSSELWQHRFSASYSLNLTDNFRVRSGFQLNFDLDKEYFSDLHQRLSNYYVYTEIESETTTDRLYNSDYRNLNTIVPASYQFTGYLPLILGRTFGRHIYAELGVMGLYRSEIRKLDQIREHDYRDEVLENDEVNVSEDQSRSTYNQRRHNSSTLFNAFSSISFSPNDQLRFRLMTYSDRRQLNPRSNINAIRFQISAEIGF